MTAVGQIEKRTQRRVVKLFREALGYGYLGDWTNREGNSNIEAELLSGSLARGAFLETGLVAEIHRRLLIS